jgi:hypothetical protein
VKISSPSMRNCSFLHIKVLLPYSSRVAPRNQHPGFELFNTGK